MRDPATSTCQRCGVQGDPHLAICWRCSSCCPGVRAAAEAANREAAAQRSDAEPTTLTVPT